MLKTFEFEKLPIVEIVNEIIIDATKNRASDIHFDPSEQNLKVRIRIDGSLIDYCIIPNEYKRNLVTRVKIISGMNITENRLPQDGAIKTSLNGVPLDMRVSSLPTNGEVFTPNVICSVGSSILSNGSGSSFPISHTVSPTLISGSPAIAIISPACASVISILFSPM